MTISTLQPLSKYPKDRLGSNAKRYFYVMPEMYPFECRST